MRSILFRCCSEWWGCDDCLKNTASKTFGCSQHSQSLLGAEAGRSALQTQLKTAKTALKKAQATVTQLEEALKAQVSPGWPQVREKSGNLNLSGKSGKSEGY